MDHSPKCFLFDLNGTMVDDMSYHLEAWHQILTEELGAKLSREETMSQLYGKNEEILIRVFGRDQFTKEEMKRISLEKEKKYQAVYKPRLSLIPGLHTFIEQSKEAGILLGIGSAAIMFNIDFVLDNLHLRGYFDVIVSADDVNKSKPDPETYLKAATALKLRPADCIVFEDAPKGVEAAMRASMFAVVVTTMHGEDEFKSYPNILHFIGDYYDPWLGKFLSK